MQGSVRDFSISIVKNTSQNKTIIRICCEKNPSKNKDTQLRKSNMQWGKRHTKMLRLLNFLAYTRINWHSCSTLCTLFVKPWLMKNNQRICPTEPWKCFINSWNSCLMYGWFSRVNVIFLSFDTSHRPAI